MTARGTGCQGSTWNPPAGQKRPAGVSVSISPDCTGSHSPARMSGLHARRPADCAHSRGSATIVDCELTHLARAPIDVAVARGQHDQYERTLRALGCRVERVAEAPDMPDSVFIEDTAVVFDEVAIITRPGAHLAASRDDRRRRGAGALSSPSAHRPAGNDRRRRRAGRRQACVRRPVHANERRGPAAARAMR